MGFDFRRGKIRWVLDQENIVVIGLGEYITKNTLYTFLPSMVINKGSDREH